MPDKVVPVRSLKGVKVDQVCVGSCTNSSLYDMLKAAAMLKGKTVAPSVSMSVSPGSRQVLTMLANCGALSDILASGARLLECACGPCIGMGFSPNSGGVSLRTFNRNFEGRSGTADAKVYLVSPETAVAAALTGEITDPRDLGLETLHVEMPDHFLIDDSAVLAPAAPEDAAQIGGASRSQHQGIPSGQACGGRHHRQTDPKGRRQHHHRPRPQAPRSCPTAPTSPSCRSSASPCATRSSPKTPRQPGKPF